MPVSFGFRAASLVLYTATLLSTCFSFCLRATFLVNASCSSSFDLANSAASPSSSEEPCKSFDAFASCARSSACSSFAAAKCSLATAKLLSNSTAFDSLPAKLDDCSSASFKACSDASTCDLSSAISASAAFKASLS